jgi:hypothetical protein
MKQAYLITIWAFKRGFSQPGFNMWGIVDEVCCQRWGEHIHKFLAPYVDAGQYGVSLNIYMGNGPADSFRAAMFPIMQLHTKQLLRLRDILTLRQ